MKRTVFLAAAMLLACSVSYSNIANPDLPNSKKSIDTTLRIQLDRDAKEARLIIPRNQIKKLRAELESLDTGADNTAAAVSTRSGLSGTQTVMSGLCISLGLVIGGIWFARRKGFSRPASQVAAAVAATFAFGGFAAIVYGNAAPPSEARSITGKMFSQAVHFYGFGSGKIRLEVSETENSPVLIVPNTPSRDEKVILR